MSALGRAMKHGFSEEVWFNRLDILLKSQNKWWETFHELVDHGNLNRNEGENQNPLRPSPEEHWRYR